MTLSRRLIKGRWNILTGRLQVREEPFQIGRGFGLEAKWRPGHRMGQRQAVRVERLARKVGETGTGR